MDRQVHHNKKMLTRFTKMLLSDELKAYVRKQSEAILNAFSKYAACCHVSYQEQLPLWEVLGREISTQYDKLYNDYKEELEKLRKLDEMSDIEELDESASEEEKQKTKSKPKKGLFGKKAETKVEEEDDDSSVEEVDSSDTKEDSDSTDLDDVSVSTDLDNVSDSESESDL